MNVIGIVGWKNTGKTTLASAVIHELSSRGLTVNAINHAHYLVDIDQPGTDSYKHRQAGAQEVILAGGQRFAAPAMALLAGGEWFEPRSYPIPANFSKNKKPGRSEMLRARVRDVQVEVFGSEGSGRVTDMAQQMSLLWREKEACWRLTSFQRRSQNSNRIPS
ncbi:molybdopterin-guanine dinucleotide biosynthesis protein B [Marinobacter nauticus]|uniref:molybdopterin-guanine dinucleotide biosynthesis protein B n=1 Tax=Marinobacter nauticus TaxID=2743 RepID=UPI0009FB93ED|nr:molybdopterin-guanine dinucleotide biosynthesis protein B [Marinobacter nauticus]